MASTASSSSSARATVVRTFLADMRVSPQSSSMMSLDTSRKASAWRGFSLFPRGSRVRRGGDNAKPARKETLPAGNEPKPAGKGALPAGNATKPTGKGRKPAGKAALPAGLGRRSRGRLPAKEGKTGEA